MNPISHSQHSPVPSPFLKRKKVPNARAGTNGRPQNARESMQAFPEWTQPFWTWLTGCALPGEKRTNATPWTYLSVTFGLVLLGLTVAVASVAALSVWTRWSPLALVTLFYAQLLAAGAFRTLHIVCAHHCIHRSFSGRLCTDRNVAELISVLIFMVPWEQYINDHVGVHHSKKLATQDDGDVRMLLDLGFRPGMTRRQYWRKLATSVVSPKFHWQFTMARLRWNVLSPETPRWRRAAAIAFHGSLALVAVGLSITLGSLFPLSLYLFAWIVPLGPLFAISALIQWCSEHKWLIVETAAPGMPYRVLLARLTNGRFVGDVLPGSRAELGWLPWLGHWILWWLRLLFVHLWVRLYLLCGDLPVHDYHHRHARDKKWVQALYSRADAVAHPSPGDEPWTEVWNLTNAINSIFDTLSSLPPLPNRQPRLSNSEKADVFQGM